MFFPRSDKKAKNTIQIQVSLSKFYTSCTKYSIYKVPTLRKEQTFHTELDMPMYLVFLTCKTYKKKKPSFKMPRTSYNAHFLSSYLCCFKDTQILRTEDTIKCSKGCRHRQLSTRTPRLTSPPVQWPTAKHRLMNWYPRGKIQNKLSPLPHRKYLLPLRRSSATLWKHPGFTVKAGSFTTADCSEGS